MTHRPVPGLDRKDKELTDRANGDYVYIEYARALFDYLDERGISAQQLATAAGIDKALLQDAQATLNADQYCRLWEEAVALTGDINLGLHVGEVMRLGKYGILGYAMLSSATLQDALERQRRYQDLVGKVGHSELNCQQAVATLQWHSPLALLSRHISEEHLASWVAFARMMLGPEQQLLSVSFVHPAPPDTSEHQRIFQCELRFEQPSTALSFERTLLNMPLREKNPVMQSLMDAHAEQLLRLQTSTRDNPLDDVRQQIRDHLIQGTPTLEQIAAATQSAPRSLQRQLATHGWSYKGLLDDVRKTLAVEYMRDRQLSILDIAFALGFSEQSPFQRAFKRWTGQTPGQYRAGLATEPD